MLSSLGIWLPTSKPARIQSSLRRSGAAWAFSRAEGGRTPGFISKQTHLTHFSLPRAEPHILLFKRSLGTDPRSGQVNSDLKDEHDQRAEE